MLCEREGDLRGEARPRLARDRIKRVEKRILPGIDWLIVWTGCSSYGEQ